VTFPRNGIASGIHYPVPIHRSPAYEWLTNGHDPAPVATRLAGRICSLPIFPGLSSAAAERIAEVVRSVHS